jgi:hypothetical protein
MFGPFFYYVNWYTQIIHYPTYYVRHDCHERKRHLNFFTYDMDYIYYLAVCLADLQAIACIINAVYISLC